MSEHDDARHLFGELENLHLKDQNKESFVRRMGHASIVSLGGFAASLVVNVNSENLNSDHTYLGRLIDEYDQYAVQGGAIVGATGLAVGAAFTTHRAWQKLNEPMSKTAKVETADAIPSRLRKVRNAGKRIMMSVVSTHAFMHQYKESSHQSDVVGIFQADATDTLVKPQNLEEFYWYDHDNFDESYRYN